MLIHKCCMIVISVFIILTATSSATVNIVVSTYDGLIIAADSRLTSQDSSKTRISTDFADKIKRVGSHVAITFSGAAHLLGYDNNLRSIASLIDSYKNAAGIQDTTRTYPLNVANSLDSFLKNIYNKHVSNVKRGQLSILVCGFNKDKERRLYELNYPRLDTTVQGKPQITSQFDSIFSSGIPGGRVMGQFDVWHRLIKGYDRKLIEYECFSTSQTDSATIEQKLDLNDLRYDIRYDLMTIQDAIDFSLFIIRATIEAQRFNELTVQGVGGAIDVAIITSEGFKWIQHKELRGE